MTKPDPFRYFKTSREVIRLAVMMYVSFLFSLRNVEDFLHERAMLRFRRMRISDRAIMDGCTGWAYCDERKPGTI